MVAEKPFDRLSERLKILILKPSSLGDVVQALPVLRLLKHHLPQSEIYWWLAADLVPLLEGDPDLAGIFRFERRRWASLRHWNELFFSIRQMRAMKFDWVIDLQALARSGFVAWLSAGNLMIGLDDAREGARGFYDLIVPRPTFHTHAVDWYLRVLNFLDIPVHWNFNWLPARPDAAVSVQQKWSPNSHRWLVIQPGARWPNKRWPVEYFQEVVRRLAADYTDLRFAIMGGVEDKPIGGVIARAEPSRCLDLTGETSLSEMIEWIRISDIMITNDTGPMHVAAALRKPVVAMFGPTEPRRTGPYRQVEQVIQLTLPCVPCFKATCSYEKPLECLRAIAPSAVCEQVRRRLEG